MRTTATFTVLSLVTMSLGALAACGDDSSPGAAQPAATTPDTVADSTAVGPPGAVIVYTGDFASPYCVTARDWAAHEVDEHDWSGSAESNEAYWNEYVTFAETAHAQAPADIAEDWDTYAVGKEEQGAVLARYGFDGERFEAEATEADRAVLDGPFGDLKEAIDDVLRYEAEVCRTSFLAAADISYSGDPNSDYCRAWGELRSVVASPAALEQFFNGENDEQYFARLLAAAPSDIRADQEVLIESDMESLPTILADHGWDVRRVLREGSEAELITFFHAAPGVRDADARQTAYAEQVCELS